MIRKTGILISLFLLSSMMFLSSCADILDLGSLVVSDISTNNDESSTNEDMSSTNDDSNNEVTPSIIEEDPLYSLSVSGGKRTFSLGEEFSSSGLIVTLEGEDDDTTLDEDEYVVDSSSYDKTNEGEYVINVSYKDDSRAKTSYKVTVNLTTYSISYDLDGGSLNVSNPTSYTYRSETFTLNNPTKSGYNFVGWAGTGLSEETANVTIENGSIGNRNYVAHYSIDTCIISFYDDNKILINAAEYEIGEEVIFPTSSLQIPTGYQFAGWKLNDEGDVVTTNSVIASGNASYYVSLVGIQKTVTFTGLGVNENRIATYGIGLNEEAPTPVYDIYQTSYSTGDVIDYLHLEENATVSYSLIGENVTYQSLGDKFVMPAGQIASTLLYNGEYDFTASMDVTAIEHDGEWMIAGFYLRDHNDNPFQILLAGSENIKTHKEANISYYETFYGIGKDNGFTESYLTKNIRIKYINCLKKFEVYIDNICRSTLTLSQIESDLGYSSGTLDMSTFSIGFSDFQNSNENYAFEVRNFTFINEQKTELSDLVYHYNYECSDLIINDNASSYSFSYDVSLYNQWMKPGFVIKDALNNYLYIYEWDNELRVNDNKYSDGDESHNTSYTYDGVIKDDNHLLQNITLTYEKSLDVLAITIKTYENNDVNMVDATNIFNVLIKMNDIRTKTGVNYNFNSMSIGLFNHGWSSSYGLNPAPEYVVEITNINYSTDEEVINYPLTCASLVAGEKDKVTITDNHVAFLNTDNKSSYSYLPYGSKDVYLKANLNISDNGLGTGPHKGITIYTDSTYGNNAQIMFQHEGFSILQGYGWNVPTKLDENAFKYNGFLGFNTDLPGEHEVEYYIHDGKLYIIYDGFSYFDKPFDLSLINDAFTSEATYHIGLYSYDGPSLEADVLDFGFDSKARNKFYVNCTKPLDMYLIAGQSNAVGYSWKDYSNDFNVETFYNVGYAGEVDRNLGSGYVAASNIDSFNDYYWSVTKGYGRDSNCIGPEYGIAKYLDNHYEEDTKAFIFKSAAGGTALRDVSDNYSNQFGNWYSRSNWGSYTPNPNSNNPTGVQYYLFIENFRTVYNELVEHGYHPVIKGMAWMQGCNDLGHDNEYELLLKALIADIRADISDITGEDYSNMTFVIGKIATTFGDYDGTYNSNVPSFNDMQQHVADTMDNVYTVETSDLLIHNATNTEILGSDAYHFNLNDARTLGERFGEMLYQHAL